MNTKSFTDTPETHLLKRGFVDILSMEELNQKLSSQKPLKIKAGFDPTAPDLHLGHLVLLKKLKLFQEMGHEVIFLLGDFTARIGDPTGKSETRKPLTEEEVVANSKTYSDQVFKILDPSKTKTVFNADWCSPMKFEDVIRLTSHYTVARMLERDDFSKRYKQGNPISLVEFLYPLVQGYDSVHLRPDIEIGGTDQKFNLLVGRELMRDFGYSPQVVMTLPLLVGLDGVKKMSKSLNNYIGIMESPLEIFGKIMSISDELMWSYYSLLTNLSEKEIEETKSSMDKGSAHPKEIKSKLAIEIGKMMHPINSMETARDEWNSIHDPKNRKLPDTIQTEEVNSIREDGTIETLLSILVKLNFIPSVSEGRRLVQSGGLYLNEEKLTNEKLTLEKGTTYLIRQGKKGKYLKIITKS
jgi:tyrosyl-tRNA synthetase